MLILTEKTPNPRALKFLPNARLTDGRSWSFTSAAPWPVPSTLAGAILAVEGVEQVFIAVDFVTVTRAEQGPAWDRIRGEVLLILADHLRSGVSAVAAEPPSGELAADDPVEREIRQALARHVAPSVASHGGQVAFDRFDAASGVLWIRMTGACGGCPSSRMTLKAGVEQVVRRFVPEVTRVEEAKGATPAPAMTGERLKRWAASVGRGGVRPVFTHMGRLMRPRP